MSYKTISATVSEQDLAEISAAIEVIKTKMPFLIGIPDLERRKLRKLGPMREGYVNRVNNALHANTDILPPSFGLSEYDNAIALRKPIDQIYNMLLPVFTNVSCTRMAVGNEIIKRTDRGYALIKMACKDGNTNLTEVFSELQDLLKKKTKVKVPQPESVE